jgi:L-threonylcarbamoyladenylate synthase
VQSNRRVYQLEVLMLSGKKTVFLKINHQNPMDNIVYEAGKTLREGGLVAFPTETVYGLGADALNPSAVERIFEAKGRPSDNPLIVHIYDSDQVRLFANDINTKALKLMEAFWPGPLTIVVLRKPIISDNVTAGLDTVAIRMPDNKIALELLKSAGVPIAAPSANSSGKPSPTTAQHVIDDLNGKIDMIVDGGACIIGVESTVLDMTQEPPVILRPGGISREQIEGVIGAVNMAVDDEGKLDLSKSPGMKYTHYSPGVPLVVVAGNDYQIIYEKVVELIAEHRSAGKTVAVMASDETSRAYCADEVFPVGTRADIQTVARNLYYGLRYLDRDDIDIIIAEGYPEHGVGVAIMNRLKKAAGGNVITVASDQ